MLLAEFIFNIVFVMALGWYLITNLQWYDYKIERVVYKHHKKIWHFSYFIIPFIAYFFAQKFSYIVVIIYIIALFLWHKKLDKKLVLTWRVKRFLILLLSLTLFIDFLLVLKGVSVTYSVFMPLFLAYIISSGIEKFLFNIYKKQSQQKLFENKNLIVIAVTGSYGKTSMKNFIYHILSKKYKTYMTPRSVNTLGGIVRDINESLPADTEVYVCEAGARERGDIYAISQLIHPHYVVVGKVGAAHIEYFKTLENIVRTKLEIMQSDRLQKAFIYHSVTDEPHEKVEFFGDKIEDIDSNLDGTSFTIDNTRFHTNILGSFQTMNLNAAILIAKELGIDDELMAEAISTLPPVEHRLQKIEAGGKIILDDGYNGNIDGMLEAIRLCSLHSGNRVIVTPGLVESSDELNLRLIEAINSTFNLAIVTGSLNRELFEKNLTIKKIILEDKSALVDTLATETKSGDIILFANDAPNFI